MIFFRSCLFNITFYGWTLGCGIVFLPTLLLPSSVVSKVAQFWLSGVIYLCEHVLNLHFKIKGRIDLLKTGSIFAVKHQSAWETFIFYLLLADPAVVLKRDLLWIPFFGWYLRKVNVIPLSRSKNKGSRDLKHLLKKAKDASAQKRQILIFPEGTRSSPGQKGTYKTGVASLYLHLNIPVVPIAHNAGLFWPRRGFLKYPGQITLEILEPIAPGLTRHDFMNLLEDRIETKTKEIVTHARLVSKELPPT